MEAGITEAPVPVWEIAIAKGRASSLIHLRAIYPAFSIATLHRRSSTSIRSMHPSGRISRSRMNWRICCCTIRSNCT